MLGLKTHSLERWSDSDKATVFRSLRPTLPIPQSTFPPPPAAPTVVSFRQIEQIERAIRRTRRSTLERIVEALIKVKPDLGDPEALVGRLSLLAGAGLAPESEYRDRVEKRRKARWAKQHRHVLYRHIMPMLHAQLDAELTAERRALRRTKGR